MRVLVLDGEQRSALAATRSLGRAGHEVTVGSAARRSLAGASRFSRDQLCHPPPETRPAEFLGWLEEGCRHRGWEMLFPMTEVTTDLLLRERGRWGRARVPFAPIDVIDALSDKVSLYRRACRLGVPVPPSCIVEGPDGLEEAVGRIGFPAVLKPARSRIRAADGRFVSTSVVRVRGREELHAALRRPGLEQYPFLYQRLVPGRGQGIFALYRRGEPAAFFAHRRLREKPPEGGVSVLSESVPVDDELLRHARALLDDAAWHGPSMVEFKVDGREGPFLMEVNARFWGSLQLAVDAGVDFPLLMAEPSKAPPDQYLCGRRLRWFLGDLDRLYLVLKGRRQAGLRVLLREIAAFATPGFGHTRHEVFRWSDPVPAVAEFVDYVRRTFGSTEGVR